MQECPLVIAGSWTQFFFHFHFVGKISDFSNADVAVDQYHRFEVAIYCHFQGTGMCAPASAPHDVYDLCLGLFMWRLTFWRLCVQEDVQLMADMGMDAYRFSIAWSRILPSTYCHLFLPLLSLGQLHLRSDFGYSFCCCFRWYGPSQSGRHRPLQQSDQCTTIKRWMEWRQKPEYWIEANGPNCLRLIFVFFCQEFSHM